MKSKFINTEGEYLQAKIEIGGELLQVMDMFSSDKIFSGDLVNLEITAGLYKEDEEWESMFSGNPEASKMLELQSGWRYRAYGKIISIKPVIVDIGLFEIEAPMDTNDNNVIGEFIAFTIMRLDASLI